MKCPTCDVCLVKSKRLNARVWLCPECCGEWVSHELMCRLIDDLRRARTARRLARDPPHPAQLARADDRDHLFDWF